MRLSIFSSKLSLALSVLAWGLAITAVYGLLFWVWHPDIEVGADQYSLNRIKAERYVYSSINPPVVIVGSSLSALLPRRELGPGVVNLAFAGIGPMTGLDIIDRAAPRPALIVIESEFIADPGLAAADPGLADDLFFPVLYQLRRVLPGLRQEFQPATLILNLAWKKEFLPTELTMLEKPDPAILNRMLAVFKKRFATLPPKKFFDNTILKLKRYVAKLTSSGTAIVFLEMPIDPDLQGLPKLIASRRSLRETFPDIPWISLSDQGPFLTRDGLHLTHPEAAKAARLIAARLAPYRLPRKSPL
jgi:hypothetical protein